MIRRRSTLSGGSLLDMVCPINWQNDLSRGLVARWQCMPGLMGGSRLVNLTRPGDKDGNHGTLTNGPTWQGALGRPGGYGSLGFDGTDDNVAIPWAASLNVSNFTIGCWLKTTAASIQLLISRDDEGNERVFQFRLDADGTPRVVLFGTGGTPINQFTDSTAINNGAWRSLIATWDGTTLTFYIDGAPKTATANALTLNTSATFGMLLGANRSSAAPISLFNGYLDQCFIRSGSLSASEVYALYEDDLRGSPETLNWISTRTYFGVTAAAAVTRIGARNMSLPSLGRTVV